jgi:membrane dipeptidase
MKRAAVALTAILLLWLLAARFVVPAIVEQRSNHVVPPDVSPAIRPADLHKSLLIADLHADSLLWGRDLLQRSSRGDVDVPRLISGNVAIQVFSIVTKVPRNLNIERNSADSDRITQLAMAEAWPPDTWFSLKARALYQAERLREMAERSRGQLVIIRTRSDLEKHLAERKSGNPNVGAILSIEGAHALEGKLENLDALFQAGVRMVAPTHFSDTDLAGSSSGITQAGLSEKGRELVRRAEGKHIVIDLAHASAATIRDVTAMATKPVVVSHTGIKATCANNRNLSDESIRAVARTGGVIGIGYWKTAVCGNDVAAIARAIKHAVQIAGIEHVGLGSDFDGATTTPFDTAGLALITEALVNEGFSEGEIRAIMGGNVIRVLRETLPD